MSHVNIDICLRPSKRRAENAEVDRISKKKRLQTENDEENAEPEVEEKNVKERRKGKQLGCIDKVTINVC